MNQESPCLSRSSLETRDLGARMHHASSISEKTRSASAASSFDANAREPLSPPEFFKGRRSACRKGPGLTFVNENVKEAPVGRRRRDDLAADAKGRLVEVGRLGHLRKGQRKRPHGLEVRFTHPLLPPRCRPAGFPVFTFLRRALGIGVIE